MLAMRLLMLALRAMPRPVHRVLDAWSYRIAIKRRERRLKLAQAK